jgi:hypothetical protein
MSVERELVEQFKGDVSIHSYAVTVGAGNGERMVRTSYEVDWAGETIARFLYIDLGENNEEIAKAWASGFAAALYRVSRREADIEKGGG